MVVESHDASARLYSEPRLGSTQSDAILGGDNIEELVASRRTLRGPSAYVLWKMLFQFT